MGVPYAGKLLALGESVFAHLPEVGMGPSNPAQKPSDKLKPAVWLGSGLADECQERTEMTGWSQLDVFHEQSNSAGQKKACDLSSKRHRSRDRRYQTVPRLLRLIL